MIRKWLTIRRIRKLQEQARDEQTVRIFRRIRDERKAEGWNN